MTVPAVYRRANVAALAPVRFTKALCTSVMPLHRRHLTEPAVLRPACPPEVSQIILAGRILTRAAGLFLKFSPRILQGAGSA